MARYTQIVRTVELGPAEQEMIARHMRIKYGMKKRGGNKISTFHGGNAFAVVVTDHDAEWARLKIKAIYDDLIDASTKCMEIRDYANG